MRPLIPAVTAVLLLAACDPKPPAQTETTAAPQGEPASVELAQPPALAVNPTPDLPPLTANGWGKLKIGMTEAQAEAATEGFKPVDGPPDPSECRMRQLLAPADTWVMLEKGVVTRITIHQTSPLVTDQGLGVGATIDAVKAAYPAGAVTEMPHKYSPPPARDLYVWTTPGEKGVRYEVGPEGKVTEIHVGGPSIRYVEACS